MKYALLWSLLVACRGHDAPAPGTPPPDPLAAVIVSPGAAPRRVVRYAAPKGTKVELELAIDAHLAIGELSTPMPVQTFGLELVVDDVLPDGRMQLRSTIVHAGARDTGSGSATGSDEGSGSASAAGSGSGSATLEPKALAGRLASLEGTAITGTLSPDGRLSDLKLDDGGKPQPDAAQLLGGFDRIVEALPHEPIGVGARWTTARELVTAGVKTTASSTIDVTALDGDKLTFHVTTELHGADQQASLQGVVIDVAHIAGKGSGQGTIDLAHLASTTELSLVLDAQMTAQGETSPMHLEMKTALGPRQGEHSAP